jgi:hypothetical protein
MHQPRFLIRTLMILVAVAAVTLVLIVFAFPDTFFDGLGPSR